MWQIYEDNVDHVTQYKLSEAQREKQILQFTNVADPEDLRAELGAARLMAQEALEQGNTGLANALLATVAKLAHSQVTVKKMRSEYLDRATVLRLGLQVVDILAQAVEGRFPEWETVLADTADQVSTAIAVATNDKDMIGV